MKPHLSINADDLGISPGTNAAIARAHAEGVVTAASLLVNLQAFDDAVRVAQDHPTLELGLHFCLTSGRPVLPAKDVPLLVDAQGKFRLSFLSLWRLLRSGERFDALTQIAGELKAQWQRLKASGLTATRVDSHQHVHMLPGLFELVASFARQEHLRMRISAEPRRFDLLLAGGFPACAKGEMKRALLANLLPREKSLWYGMARNQACFGIVHSGRMTGGVLRRIAATSSTANTEIIVHPGESSPGETDAALSLADQRFLASPWRQRELEALLDVGVKQAFDGCGANSELPAVDTLVAA